MERSATDYNKGGFRYRYTHPDMAGPVKCVVRGLFSCWCRGLVTGGAATVDQSDMRGLGTA